VKKSRFTEAQIKGFLRETMIAPTHARCDSGKWLVRAAVFAVAYWAAGLASLSSL
jgi:hypothetical protein